jgi:hypothetical protein
VNGREQITKKLIDLEILEKTCEYINCELFAPSTICLIIDSLEAFIYYGTLLDSEDKENTCGELSELIKKRLGCCSGDKKIEELQMHPDHSVYERSSKFIEKYFNYEILDQN